MAAGTELLRAAGLGRVFAGGTEALRDVSLTLDHGDFCVLLGPSGCGKSTLLRLIAGLDAPQAGRIDWPGGVPAAGQIGFVFQDPVLMPWASALANAALPLRLRGSDAAPAREMLSTLGLGEFLAHRPAQLSGGMRMRVSIARALAAAPRVLLMDEPFAALDEFTRHRLQEEVRGLTEARVTATVFVTHSIYEAAYLATRVIVLSPRPGRVAARFAFDTRPADRLSPLFLERVALLTEALRGVHA